MSKYFHIISEIEKVKKEENAKVELTKMKMVISFLKKFLCLEFNIDLLQSKSLKFVKHIRGQNENINAKKVFFYLFRKNLILFSRNRTT